MTIQQMRDSIGKIYNTESWKDKVRYMHDNQVIAIYYNFSKRGLFDEPSKKKQPEPVKKQEPKITQQQLTMFDLLDEKGDINNE